MYVLCNKMMMMTLMYWILFVQHGYKTQNFYKECMNSSALLPLRNFAIFERQFLLEYYIQKAKKFHHVLSFTSSLAAWGQFISNTFPSVRKAVSKWAKCKQWRQHESPYTTPWNIKRPTQSTRQSAQRTMGRSNVILSNIKRFPCILIGCIFYGMG